MLGCLRGTGESPAIYGDERGEATANGCSSQGNRATCAATPLGIAGLSSPRTESASGAGKRGLGCSGPLPDQPEARRALMRHKE